MPRYEVQLDGYRKVTVSATVTVEAENPSKAMSLATRQVREGIVTPDWEEDFDSERYTDTHDVQVVNCEEVPHD